MPKLMLMLTSFGFFGIFLLGYIFLLAFLLIEHGNGFGLLLGPQRTKGRHGPSRRAGASRVEGKDYTKNRQDKRCDRYKESLNILILAIVFHYKGEKGEPGVTIAADGSVISAPRGPQGPKGIRVRQKTH